MRTIYVSIFLFLSLSSFAQKVDIDKLNARFSHEVFPKILLDSAMTFSGEFLYAKDVPFYNQAGFPRNFNLEGYRNVEKNGDILIEIKFSKILGKQEDVENKTTNKNDKGVEETKVEYNIKFETTVVYDVDVTYKGRKIQELKNLNKTSISKVFPSDLPSKDSFFDWYAKNKINYSKEQSRAIIQTLMTELGTNLTGMIGYKKDFISYDLFYLNPKKHPEGEKYQAVVKNLKEVITSSSIKKPLSRLDIQESVDYFKSLIEKFNTDSKDDKTIRSSAYTNLAIIHYMIFDLENARKYQLASNELGISPVVLQRVKDALDRMEEPNFKAAGFTSHQFDRNLDLLVVDKEQALKVAEKQKQIDQELLEYKKQQVYEKNSRESFESNYKQMANGIIEKYFIAAGGFENFKKIKNLKYSESFKFKHIPLSMNSDFVIADTSFYYEKNGKLMLFRRTMYDGMHKENREYNTTDEFTNEEKSMQETENLSPAKIIDKTSVWNMVLPFDFKYDLKYIKDTTFNGNEYAVIGQGDMFFPIKIVETKPGKIEVLEMIYFFNKKTNLCDGFDEIGDGNRVVNNHRFLEYEEIGNTGFKMPLKMEAFFSQKILKVADKINVIKTISKLKANIKIDKQEFYDYFKSTSSSEPFEMK